MKLHFYLLALVAICWIGGCRQAEPEPDFSGIQNLPFSVARVANSTAGTAHISIYPNPFLSHLTIQMHNPDNTPATIYVSDEKGKYTKKIELEDGKDASVSLDFSRLPKGVYICEVQQPGKANRYRLFKAQ